MRDRAKVICEKIGLRNQNRHAVESIRQKGRSRLAKRARRGWGGIRCGAGGVGVK